jgi:hypothetical protein
MAGVGHPPGVIDASRVRRDLSNAARDRARAVCARRSSRAPRITSVVAPRARLRHASSDGRRRALPASIAERHHAAQRRAPRGSSMRMAAPAAQSRFEFAGRSAPSRDIVIASRAHE